MRRGSALLMALWTIMVLSVIVISFSFEARLQGGINVYVQNKNRVKRLVESGRILGEAVLLGYNDAKQWTEDEDEKELLEGDRWFELKRNGCPQWWIISNGLKYTTKKYLYTAPIYKGDVDLNPNIKQNEGYVY